MTKATIKSIISECNTNESIKWGVIKNEKTVIILTNDYCNTNFTIVYSDTGIDERIIVIDENMKHTVCCLFKDDFFRDFESVDEGFETAIYNIIEYFNYCY